MKIVRDKKQLIPELESFTDMQIRDRYAILQINNRVRAYSKTTRKFSPKTR